LSDLLPLCYHAVSERWPAPLAVTPRQLRDHLAWLSARGYRGVTFGEAVAGQPPPRSVAITFDDAFRSVFEHALPILSEAGFVGTVFAPTAFVGRDRPMSWPGVEDWLGTSHAPELLPMSWEQLGALAEAGWEIGSHTRSHPRLPALDEHALDRELRGSRDEVEQRLGRPCTSLAYPYGARDARVVEAARRAGYEAAAGTLPGRLRPPRDPLEWSRMVINRIDGVRRFRLKVSPLARRAKASPAWELVVAARRARGRQALR
jgi:peptidoglycan/xylan/chitin deacetylase (PgdA/CDA1 family)